METTKPAPVLNLLRLPTLLKHASTYDHKSFRESESEKTIRFVKAAASTVGPGIAYFALLSLNNEGFGGFFAIVAAAAAFARGVSQFLAPVRQARMWAMVGLGCALVVATAVAWFATNRAQEDPETYGWIIKVFALNGWVVAAATVTPLFAALADAYEMASKKTAPSVIKVAVDSNVRDDISKLNLDLSASEPLSRCIGDLLNQRREVSMAESMARGGALGGRRKRRSRGSRNEYLSK